MSFTLHTPYPGSCLVVTPIGSVLLGVPSDAFRATKQYCNTHALPFPSVCVAPRAFLMHGRPQYNVEFFLYDFLFVQGAAFKPHMAHQRLSLVMDAEDAPRVHKALRTALFGPYDLTQPIPPHTDPHIQECMRISAHLAVHKGLAIRPLEDMIDTVLFNAQHKAWVLDGGLEITRTSPTAFKLRWGNTYATCDLALPQAPQPLCMPPAPSQPITPLRFGALALGGRSGFDPSGPTTGFVVWIDQQPVLVDGPSGIYPILHSQGIDPESLSHIVLSHCHDDHIGAALELLIQEHPCTLITSKPVYESFLQIAACCMQTHTDVVAQRIRWQEVVPHKEMDLHGGHASFFYTAHSIPALGVRFSHTPTGAQHPHSIHISGDTLDHESLDVLVKKQIVSEERHHALKHMIPPSPEPHSVFFADTGESVIHGKPSDWEFNRNNIIYYHCADVDRTNTHGHPVIAPGSTYTIKK